VTRRVAHGNRARPGARLTGVAHDSPENSPPADPPLAGFGRVIGRSRYVVLIAVVAVLLVSLTLFLLGALNAFAVTGKAWNEALAHGEFAPTDLLIEILSVIDVMLRAVVFYIIGVGLYSLFIAPLNLTAALGVDSLIDLETKVISIVIVILAVSFLEHFVRWEKPGETLNFAAALAIVVAALVVFQWNNQRAKEFEKTHRPEVQARAQSEMFQGKHEEREIRPGETREPAASAEHQKPKRPRV
jgi:uncharacterized membrane protein YqhA